MIIVHKSLKFISTDLENHSNEKDFEAFALKLYLNSKCACIITIYQTAMGNFNIFITNLDRILRKLFNSMLEYIICSDINIAILL
jgi:hypothetical protein